MNYIDTLNTLSKFFADCVRFWKGDVDRAIEDVERIERNPFSPRGSKLDEQAKRDFIAYVHEAKKRLQ